MADAPARKTPPPRSPAALLLVGLVFIAAGAVISARLVKSAVFSDAAAWVFAEAGTALVVYLARGLAGLPELKQLLREWRSGK